MKKLLVILCMFIACLACSDNDENNPKNPVQNLKLPAKGSVFLTGQSVTIEGNGFTTESQIWLRATDKVQVKVTAVNESSITFEVPEGVEGQQSVILKQNGQEYDLGKLTFKKGTEELCAFIWSDNKMGLCQLDLSAKTYKMVYPAEHPLSALTASDDGKIYFLTDTKGSDDAPILGYYDFKSKTSKTVATNWEEGSSTTAEGIAIGMINNKLHGLKYNDNKGFYLVSIDDNGKETEVVTFGKSDKINSSEFYGGDKFSYHPADNVVLVSGDYDAKRSCVTLSFNLSTKKIEAKITETESNLQTIYVDHNCYLFSYTSEPGTIIRKINPITLETVGNAQRLSEDIVDLIYYKSKKILIGIDDNKWESTIESLDPETRKITPLWPDTDFNEFVTIVL